MLFGLSFTPARQNGCEHERADPYVQASVHRSRGKGDEVCSRADLGHLRFLWRVVQELGLGTHTAFARTSFFVSFALAWSICIALDR
eukprot:1020235-Pleurochrysis_carterae.AAC.1